MTKRFRHGIDTGGTPEEKRYCFFKENTVNYAVMSKKEGAQ